MRTICTYSIIISFVLKYLILQTCVQACRDTQSILIEGTCFKLNQIDQTWNQSFINCSSMPGGGALAIFTSASQVKDPLLDFALPVWVGATYTNGTYNWESSEPSLNLNDYWNNATANKNGCVYFQSIFSLKAYTAACDGTFSFLCMELSEVTTILNTQTATSTSSTLTTLTSVFTTVTTTESASTSSTVPSTFQSTTILSFKPSTLASETSSIMPSSESPTSTAQHVIKNDDNNADAQLSTGKQPLHNGNSPNVKYTSSLMIALYAVFIVIFFFSSY